MALLQVLCLSSPIGATQHPRDVPLVDPLTATHLSCVLVADDEHSGHRLQLLDEVRWAAQLHDAVHGVVSVTLGVLDRHKAAGAARSQQREPQRSAQTEE